MSDPEVEEMLLELESEILALKLNDLSNLANEMKLDKSSIEGKSKFLILKSVRKDIEEKVGNLAEKAKIIEYLDNIKTFLGPPPLEENTEESEIIEKSPEEQQVLELQEQIEKLMSKQKEIQSKMGGAQKNDKSSVAPEDILKVPLASLEKSVLHRDFKIQGIIGEPGQKDKLGYQPLISQIEAGLRKKYTELEIVNAVVRAVQPGLLLRGYLESISNLTLPTLRKIIRFHFHERSATELYQTLANITQEPKEDPQSFLIRALTIRQKIIFASKEADSNITYDESSVQGLFLHALETGLIDETIRAKMRPTIKTPGVADEKLIEAMNMAMSAETERINKFNFSGRTKPARVSVLEMVSDKVKDKKEDGRVLAALKSVQSEMATMQAEMKTLRGEVTKAHESTNDARANKPKSSGGSKRGCADCQEKGLCDTCDHCFLCGGSNHLARHCKLKYKNQGNRKGLPPRDRV